MSSAVHHAPRLLNDFCATLRPRLTGELRTDAMTRALYATDASLYEIKPLGVLFPRHADDVQAAMETAASFSLPVLPRGGGSSLAGQTVGAALVIDFSRHLDQLRDVNVEERWVCVQPGMVLDHLNAALVPYGLMVGPDPASSNRATLGGMAANNATGTHSILYGNMIRHVRSARALLAGGAPVHFEALSPEAWQARQRLEGPEGHLYSALTALLEERGDVIERDTSKHWRRNSGYRLEALLEGPERNLARLLCGSEGTLAVTTELTLGLVPRPQRTALGIVHFHTRREALEAVTAVLETEPSAVELLDGIAIGQCRRAPGFASLLTFIDGEPGAVLITEYYGNSNAALWDRLDALEKATVGAGRAYGVLHATTQEQISNVWHVRKEGLGLVMGVKGPYKPVAFIEDAAVPVEHLAAYIDDLSRVLEETDTRVVLYAHASAGCLHVRPFINTKDAREVEKMREIAEASMAMVSRYGGVISSEHGDGIVRGWLNERFLGPALYDVNRRLKELFDPNNLLNPGKVVEVPAMTEQLRLGPSYKTIPVLTEMDFSREEGFAGAVELCNGNGACRKLQSGTMCPSFMVTREEEHSTRGRANALRAALSGTLPPSAFTGERLYEVMDLCIQCKACKTECPSNVDMAKLKTEWLSKYWEANGMPLRTKLFARLPRVSRKIAGTSLADSVNWMRQRPAVRWMLSRTLGISEKRALPPFAREPFTAWFRAQTWASSGPPVVLFADTFNNYHHPAPARAAAAFLQHIGFQVIVPEAPLCCGRTFLSKGLVSEAQLEALNTVEQLYRYAEQAIPIVGLEPSCILTLGDEFLSLLPGEPRAQKLAGVALTFEAFVAHMASLGALADVTWKDEARHVLLHGHCHQKALVGTGPAERCLSLPPGYTVETVDSGCCGMAGAFGYEKEHYDVSVRMAERRLMPAIRAAGEEVLLAAAGTSCRAQIEDLTGRHALHPAEILYAALAEPQAPAGQAESLGTETIRQEEA